MNLLFDTLGPEARAPNVRQAIEAMADAGAAERGAVFTRPEVVAGILDLCGYTVDRPLHRLRLLEPSFGDGEFLLLAVDRLLAAWARDAQLSGTGKHELASCIRAVELNRTSFEGIREKIRLRLIMAGLADADASDLILAWLICDDFLLCHLPDEFDVVVGNPPYVRQERIPDALLTEYRGRYRTLFDRADLYVPFFERSLDLLSTEGVLGFICANRWLKNRYGGPLRAKIEAGFELSHFIDMEGIDAFHVDVLAYPAITIIHKRPPGATRKTPTRIGSPAAIGQVGLASVIRSLCESGTSSSVDEVALDGGGDAPWLLDDPPRLILLRRLEATFPMLESSGCKVGIGVATGCDRVFIADFNDLPVEPERKLPLVMARDLVNGAIHWKGKGVLNPYEADGSLVQLDAYPRFAAYLEEHREELCRRHVAGRNPRGWYRTIDRITPGLTRQPKLLIPDIKGAATFVLDDGNYYPHHNLYHVTSNEWELRALQAVLRSSLSVLIVSTYCTRMSGGFLRFQAQYLRRIRLPHWSTVPAGLRQRLAEVANEQDTRQVDVPVFELYRLSDAEAAIAERVALQAQVTARNGNIGT